MNQRSYLFTAIAGTACLVACGSVTNPGGSEDDAGPLDAAAESAVDSGADGPSADAPPDVHDTDATDGGGGEGGDGGGGGACSAGLYSVSGSVGLLPSSFCDATAWWWTNPSYDDAGARNEIMIHIMDKPSACASGFVRAGVTDLELVVHEQDALLVPRTYPISLDPTYGAGFALLQKRDSSCEYSGINNATSGTISITAMSGTMLSGTFDLTFPDGTLTGSFDVPVCGDPFSIGCVP